MAKALWGGAFEKETSEKILEFNSSENIALDGKLIFYDIIGSLAHVKMLGEQGIIKKNEVHEIAKALVKIEKEFKKGEFKLDPGLEDVHMNIEAAVTKITSHAKNMHIARSRNDQILLDMRLFMRDENLMIINNLIKLQKAFIELSKKDGVMVAYTHTRVAQPITISFWCDAFVKSFERDAKRLKYCYKRINQNPLGAGAIAGTSWDISREKTAKLLGFEEVQENALDTITSRGECEAELASCLSIVMMKLSRLCEELIWLSQKKLVKIPEEFTTGSSMMPNKKNPDVLELVRGRSARVYSNLMHILIVMKGLMSGYNSDIQETKFAVMQATKITRQSLDVIADIVPELAFSQKKITEELEQSFAQATELADLLTKKGMHFREAHEMTGKLVKYCEKNGMTFSKLTQKEIKRVIGVDLNEDELKKTLGLGRSRLKISLNEAPLHKNQEWLAAEQGQIRKTFDQLLQI